MMKGFVSSAVTAITLMWFAVIPAVSQTTGNVVGEELKTLVSGRTWAISYSDPTNRAYTYVWDFRKNGSVCARSAGSMRSDKCADEGKWSIRDERLCWELSWMGEALKLKTACSFVKKTGNDRFELRNEKTPELTFLVFTVL
jgi:hypothetical protein